MMYSVCTPHVCIVLYYSNPRQNWYDGYDMIDIKNNNSLPQNSRQGGRFIWNVLCRAIASSANVIRKAKPGRQASPGTIPEEKRQKESKNVRYFCQ